MFVAALFTVTNYYEQFKYTSTVEQVNSNPYKVLYNNKKDQANNTRG